MEEGAKVTAEVSLNVLMGLDSLDSSPSTIKILGRVKRIPLVILIDCGSTHSFINPNVPKKLGLLGEPMKRAMRVNVASGHKMVSTHLNPSFVWEMNYISFTFNLHWLKVPDCDIFLGMDWIDSVAPVLLHTNPHSISFIMGGTVVTLFGSQEAAQISSTNAKAMMKLLQENYCSFVAHTELNALKGTITRVDIPTQLEELLSSYVDLFS